MGMPPNAGGRHRVRSTGRAGGIDAVGIDPSGIDAGGIDAVTITVARAARSVAEPGSTAEFAYPSRFDAMDDTAPIPVRIPGPRVPLDGPTIETRPVRIDAGTQRLFAVGRTPHEQPGETDLPAVVRGRRFALAGAVAVTVCAAYVAAVGVSVLHGNDAGPVGGALAGLLPPTVAADAGTSLVASAAPAAVAGQVVPTPSVQVAAPPTTRAEAGRTARAVQPRAAASSSSTVTARVPTASEVPSAGAATNASPAPAG